MNKNVHVGGNNNGNINTGDNVHQQNMQTKCFHEIKSDDFDIALKEIRKHLKQELVDEFAEIINTAKLSVAENDAVKKTDAKLKFNKFIRGAGSTVKLILQSSAQLAAVATYFGIPPKSM